MPPVRSLVGFRRAALAVAALTLVFSSAAELRAATTIALQAEDAVLSGPLVLSVHPGYRGTGYADFGANLGEYIEWTVETSEAGFYAVSFRYALEMAAARPLDLTVNGGAATVVDFPSTGEWFVWNMTDKVEVQLLAGTNTIRLTAATNVGANIDELRVSVIPDPDDIITYEAEEAVLVGPAISVQHEGYTGEGFADYGETLDEYIEWTIDAPVHGFYSVAFRYALNAAARPLLVQIDGDAGVVVDFPRTNEWTNWSLTDELEVELEAGEHKIRATATGNFGPNVDSVIVALLGALEPENFPPTSVSLDNSDVPEGVFGAAVGNVIVEDANEDDEHTFAVSDARFEIIEGVLMLLPAVALDHETEPTVTLDITATDLGGASVTSTLVIEVLDGGPFHVVLEAEDGTFNRAWVGSAIPGFTGEGYLRFSRRIGASVSWNVSIPSTGWHLLKFRYAGPYQSTMKLRVNGVVKRWHFPFPRMKRRTWCLWRDNCVPVYLEAGENTIRLDALGRRRILLDSLTILEK